jgi:ankyrin repeat protein
MSRFDFAKILTQLFVLEVGLIRSNSRFFRRKVESLVDSGGIVQYRLSIIRSSRTDIDRAADALISWLSLSKVPLSERALEEVFNNVLRNWKNSAAEGNGSSSIQIDISPSDSEKLSVSAVLQWCEPFVTVDHGNGLVRFSSAATEQAAAHAHSESTERELALFVAKSCLDYLDSADDFAKGRCATDAELATMLQRHAFLEHAAHFAVYVALNHDVDCEGHEDVDEKVWRLLSSPKRFLAMQAFLYTDKEDPDQDKTSSSWDEFSRWIDSMSQFHVASRWGLLKTVKTLLEKGEEDVKLTDSHGSIPLHEAAKSGAAGVVQALLEADIGMAYAVDDKGKTPLFYAWRGDHGGALVLLFEAQCTSLTIKDLGDISGTELDNAVQKYCLAKSQQPNGTDEAVFMGIAMVRAIKGNLDVIATLLIHRDADTNAVVDGKSALYTAVQQGQDDLAASLLSNGANPLGGVPEGLEPVLHLAVRKRLWLTVQELLDSRSINVNCKDSKGRTALFAAMETEDEEWAMDVTRLLLWHRLDVDERDNDHRHIMHIVAEKGYAHVFSEIMSRSRLVQEPEDNDHKTPFDIALENGNKKIATFLRPTYDV